MPRTRRPGSHDDQLVRRLRRELEGEVLFDRLNRGRYSTDASIYQIEPVGVVLPRSLEDVVRTVEIAREEGVPVLPRGAGTSQGGQAVGEALIVDTSRHLDRVLELHPEEATVVVEPGIVLDALNASLRPHGLFFPVDVATASRATLGGMAGNNSSGARSIRYGIMADNVHAVDALLSTGEEMRFAPWPVNGPHGGGVSPRHEELVRLLLELRAREQGEIEARVPRVLRHVAGYNLHRLTPQGGNLAELLVGSEGTLAFFTRLTLKLQPILPHRVVGVCHFPRFAAAMEATRHLVELGPTAVELFDRSLLELGRRRDEFRGSIERFVVGDPAALLLVELAAEEEEEVLRGLGRLEELMTDLGYPGAVVKAIDGALQQEIWAVRRAGLNIMMSRKGDLKPVSFIEDCAVPLEHLAEYTARLEELFRRHGTQGTWYAHASVGCLHVRPLLNLKEDSDLGKMRSLAEATHELVQELHGSHSGEHGDGLVRSEFLEKLQGRRLVRAFEEVKQAFDPLGLFNPGKIVHPPAMDDRSLLRYFPQYRALDVETALDWSPWGGWLEAVEMCNNNGACRKMEAGVMCPSYRVTRDETHVTRGRANSLRLALSGQLGSVEDGVLASRGMYDVMDLCIGCKACRRECPTGVDMARMKVELLRHYRARHGLGPGEAMAAYLPRYAPWASRFPFLFNLPNQVPLLARLGERVLGLTAQRPLPTWRRDIFSATSASQFPRCHSIGPGASQFPAKSGRLSSSIGSGASRLSSSSRRGKVLLWVDTFNTYFEPENPRAAVLVLEAAGYEVLVPHGQGFHRPPCCGRTFLAAGLVDEAKLEARRLLASLSPYAEAGIPIVGLEPSCLLTLRDELPAMFPGAEAGEVVARRAVLLSELLDREAALEGYWWSSRSAHNSVLVHGHCHEKAFGVVEATLGVLRQVPKVEVNLISSSCCGMAGFFGYEAKHYPLSCKMAELDLLPAIRSASDNTIIVANGTSCRQQIHHGTNREAWHLARFLASRMRPLDACNP